MKNISVISVFVSICIFVSKGNALGVDCTETPCPIDDKSIRFFVLGNWGGTEEPPYVTPVQQSCADLTFNMSVNKKPQFFVSTGNNFYDHGVQSAEDPRFKTTFDDVFLYGKDSDVPWYVVAGNRDWFGNVTAQVEYTKLNSRWVFPSLAYSAQYDARPRGPAVDIIYIDTVVLCGNAWDEEANDDDAKSGKRGKMTDDPRGPEDLEWSESLWAWIEEQMANSTADYLLVVGHYPAFAADRHNISSCLVPRLQNLLEKYNATAYISGHSHNLQHVKTVSPSSRPIHHVISGGGQVVKANHKPFDLIDNPWKLSSEYFFPKETENGIKSQLGVGGLVYADLGLKSGTFEFYQCNGDFLYSFLVDARTA